MWTLFVDCKLIGTFVDQLWDYIGIRYQFKQEDNNDWLMNWLIYFKL